jgi:hypothetical protein
VSRASRPHRLRVATVRRARGEQRGVELEQVLGRQPVQQAPAGLEGLGQAAAPAALPDERPLELRRERQRTAIGRRQRRLADDGPPSGGLLW